MYMRLFTHITTLSFTQSYRRFEQSSYVHTFRTNSRTYGIGFLHHTRHSYFFMAS